MDAPELERIPTEAGCELRLRGAWCIDQLPRVDHLLADLNVPHDREVRVDAAGLTRLDSAGVMLLVNRLRAQGVVWSDVLLKHFNPAQMALIHLVAERLDARPRPPRRRYRWRAFARHTGRTLGARLLGQAAFLSAASPRHCGTWCGVHACCVSANWSCNCRPWA